MQTLALIISSHDSCQTHLPPLKHIPSEQEENTAKSSFLFVNELPAFWYAFRPDVQNATHFSSKIQHTFHQKCNTHFIKKMQDTFQDAHRIQTPPGDSFAWQSAQCRTENHASHHFGRGLFGSEMVWSPGRRSVHDHALQIKNEQW